MSETLPSPFVTGFTGRCPHCGEGALFKGYLTVRPACQSCGTSFDFADSGDGPAVFIMLLVGAVVVAGALWMEFTFDPPAWLHVVVWLPVTAILSLAVLRPMKGMMIALQYVNGAREGRFTRGE